jgi:hypothetical protein
LKKINFLIKRLFFSGPDLTNKEGSGFEWLYYLNFGCLYFIFECLRIFIHFKSYY